MKDLASESMLLQSHLSKIRCQARQEEWPQIKIGVLNWFGRQTFHVLDSMCQVQYMKSLEAESILLQSHMSKVPCQAGLGRKNGWAILNWNRCFLIIDSDVENYFSCTCFNVLGSKLIIWIKATPEVKNPCWARQEEWLSLFKLK